MKVLYHWSFVGGIHRIRLDHLTEYRASSPKNCHNHDIPHYRPTLPTQLQHSLSRSAASMICFNSWSVQSWPKLFMTVRNSSDEIFPSLFSSNKSKASRSSVKKELWLSISTLEHLILTVFIGTTIPVPYKHDDVINWKHFPRHWPFVRGIHRWPVNSPHSGQSRGALIFSSICTWINDWINSRAAVDLRRHRASWRHCNI